MVCSGNFGHTEGAKSNIVLREMELDLPPQWTCRPNSSAGQAHLDGSHPVKIFATALTLSQVTTTPDAVKTQFDRSRDQPEVARLLSAGCAHMRKAFDIEDINLDELIATAMDDPQAITSESVSRHRFCRSANGLPSVLQE